jgi:CheY-like chemotaxis protein
MSRHAHGPILVVAHDAGFCYLMRRYADESARQVVFAYLGEEALDLARRKAPAAIVLAFGPLDTTSWSVLRELKSEPSTCGIPVVLCAWPEDEARGREEGADAYLCMPVLYADFVAALAAVGAFPVDSAPGRRGDGASG